MFSIFEINISVFRGHFMFKVLSLRITPLLFLISILNILYICAANQLFEKAGMSKAAISLLIKTKCIGKASAIVLFIKSKNQLIS